MTVQQVLDWLNALTPFESAESFDNVGLLMGDAGAEVHTVLFGMDVTEELAREAASAGAELIVTHHPFIFHALKRIDYTGPQGRTLCLLARGRVSVIAAHTNWDKASGGVSDSLAQALGLRGVVRADDYLRVGELPEPLSADAFNSLIAERLHIRARRFGPLSEPLSRVAVAGGAYGEGGALAASMGAQAFVVGEIRHHELLDACARGLAVYDAGHFPTELPGVTALYERFLADMTQADEPVRAMLHANAPYPGALLAF